MKRIIFVGIHNKPGKLPLDNSTKTGKIIDIFEKKLGVKVERTNLFNVDYSPKETNEIINLRNEWFYTNLPCFDDIVVLLGNDVQKYFPFVNSIIIKVKHPAMRRSKDNQLDYINNVVNLIDKLNK